MKMTSMKRNIVYTFLASLLIVFAGCDDSFLDAELLTEKTDDNFGEKWLVGTRALILKIRQSGNQAITITRALVPTNSGTLIISAKKFFFSA